MATPAAKRRALEVLALGDSPILRPFQELASLAPPLVDNGYGPQMEIRPGAGAPLATPEDEALRQRAAVGGLMADMGQSASRGIETLTGAPGAGQWEEQRKRAGEPLRDFMLLQKQKAKAKAPGAGKPGKSTDPNSPESMRWRAVFKQMFPSEDDSNITESNAETAIKYLTAQRGQDTSVGNATAGITMRQKELDQRAQQWAEQRGIKLSELSLDQRKFVESIVEAERDRSFKKEMDDKKVKRELAERNVGGFDLDPTNPPSPDASKKMADAAISRDDIIGSLDNLERLYKSKGSEFIGDDAGVMGAEWKNITDGLRNMSNMGVPNGKDYEMLALQIENPADLKAMLTSKSRGLAMMKTVREQIARRMDATAKALKFKPKAPTPKRQPPATPAQTAPSTPARRPVSETLSKDGTKKRITYSDGSVEVVDAKP